MKNQKLLELNSSELNEITGGGIFIPVLIWVGKAVATTVIGYLTYEVVDGVVRGIANDCDCQ